MGNKTANHISHITELCHMTKFEIFMFLMGTCFGAAVATVYAVTTAEAKAMTDKAKPRVHTDIWGI